MEYKTCRTNTASQLSNISLFKIKEEKVGNLGAAQSNPGDDGSYVQRIVKQ